MTDISFSLTVNSVDVKALSWTNVNIEFESNLDDIFSHFKLQDIINYYGAEQILNEIGLHECRDHFDLTEKL